MSSIKQIPELRKYLSSPHSAKVVFNSDGTWHPISQNTFPAEGFTIGTQHPFDSRTIDEAIGLIEKDILLLQNSNTARYAGHNTQYI